MFDTRITPTIRPSSYILVLHKCSVNRETSLSSGERPLTSCPGSRQNLYRIDYLHLHPPFRLSFCSHPGCHWATTIDYFRYTWISPIQGKVHSLAFPPFTTIATSWGVWVIPAQQASITAPESFVLFCANNSAIYVSAWRFPPPL